MEPRYDFTATTLPNGKVLLAGGNTNTQATVNLDTAELFDPATGTFGAGGNVARYYDPSTEKFYYKGKLTAARGKHTATLLKDGTVLIAGGGNAGGTAQATAELYDPTSAKMVNVESMKVARQEHRATLIANGDVLMTGGVDNHGQVLATTEIYHPATRRFTFTTAAFPGRVTNLGQGRYEHAAALLPNGQVLIAGGSDGKAATRSAELYDPSRGAFICIGGQRDATVPTCPASMNDYRISAVTALLPNGEVLLAGGYNFQLGPAHNIGASQSMMGGATAPFSVLWSAEVYNPAAGVFVSTVAIAHAHFGGSGH